MEIELILAVIIAHWVGDYVLQSESMAVGKATSLRWLTIHVLVWTASIGIITLYFGTTWDWILAMGVAHWLQDFVTSKINSYYQRTKQLKLFWLSIGTDQMLHYCVLFGSLYLWYGY